MKFETSYFIHFIERSVFLSCSVPPRNHRYIAKNNFTKHPPFFALNFGSMMAVPAPELPFRRTLCLTILIQLGNFNSIDGVLYCRPHYDQIFKRTGSHKSCFKCTHGGCTISPSNYIAHEGKLYCKHHHIQLFKAKGNYSQLETELEKDPSLPTPLEDVVSC